MIRLDYARQSEDTQDKSMLVQKLHLVLRIIVSQTNRDKLTLSAIIKISVQLFLAKVALYMYLNHVEFDYFFYVTQFFIDDEHLVS